MKSKKGQYYSLATALYSVLLVYWPLKAIYNMTHSHMHIYRPVARTVMQNVHLFFHMYTDATIICNTWCRIKPINSLWTNCFVLFSRTKLLGNGPFYASWADWLLLNIKSCGKNWSLSFCTCNMLRLQGSCFFRERIFTFKRKDRFSGHVIRLVPRSIRVVVMIGEMNDISKMGGVFFIGQPIFTSYRLDPIDHLDWKAVGEGSQKEACGYGYSSTDRIQHMRRPAAASVTGA